MKNIYRVLAVLALCTGLWLMRHCSRETPGSHVVGHASERVARGKGASSPDPDDSGGLASFVSAIFASVEFYGKVVDQHGNPVADATVSLAVSDKVGGGSTDSKMRSDSKGLFTVKSRGMSLYVTVKKEGYYTYRGLNFDDDPSQPFSEEGFDFAQDFGKGIHQPDKSNPVIFHLYKGSPVKDLRRVGGQSILLPRDGTLVVTPLDLSVKDPNKTIGLRCWTRDNQKGPDGRYDWRLEITIPVGKLQERKGDFEFLAPETGYMESVTIEMPATLSREKWKGDAQKKYWIRYNDGTHGRLTVLMAAGGEHYAKAWGYLSPRTGDRNLETDPNRR